MATVDFNVGSRKQPHAGGGERSPKASAHSDDLPLFRFGLRQLLVFVAAFSALLAALAISHGLTVLLILLAVSIVVMHVFATALGTRLRSRADLDMHRTARGRTAIDEHRTATAEQSVKLEAIRSSPRSPWHGHRSTYLPWLPWLVVGAMLIGGVGGGIVLNSTIGHRTSIEGIIVGAVSCAILGGWVSFLGGNFYGVFRHGFREALAEQCKDQSGRPRKKK